MYVYKFVNLNLNIVSAKLYFILIYKTFSFYKRKILCTLLIRWSYIRGSLVSNPASEHIAVVMESGIWNYISTNYLQNQL